MKKTSNSENLILQLFWNNKYQIACHEIYKRVREAYPNHWKDSSILWHCVIYIFLRQK